MRKLRVNDDTFPVLSNQSVFFSLTGIPPPGSSRTDIKKYGQIYRMRLHVLAKSLEFISSRHGESVVLWKEDDPSKKDSRRKVVGYSFVLYNVTQEDSGKYTMRDRYGLQLSDWTLDVEGDSTNNSCSVIPISAVLLCDP